MSPTSPMMRSWPHSSPPMSPRKSSWHTPPLFVAALPRRNALACFLVVRIVCRSNERRGEFRRGFAGARDDAQARSDHVGIKERAATAVRPLSPFLRGEGWGEGLYPARWYGQMAAGTLTSPREAEVGLHEVRSG